MIEVLNPGRLTSVQDRGRNGLERYGIPPGGAADWFSAAVANRLVGNEAGAALLEITATGPSVRFDADTTLAITGGDCVVEEGPVGWAWAAHRVGAGTVLKLGQVNPGFRSYLAFRGGIDVPAVLGSRSLSIRGGFGGGFGRPLQRGDRLPLASAINGEPLPQPWPAAHRPQSAGPWEIRVVPGPHSDAFPRTTLERLTATACRITPSVDRMGLRVETPGLRLQAAEIVTTAVTSGAIQVTPSGELIALLVDHPTTGGYPVIATVITADQPLLAQARPGDTVRFRTVDLEEARRALRRVAGWLDPETNTILQKGLSQ
jgi:antagonist of KipI